MIAFVFPGQGSQYIGMGKDVFDSFKVARETFEEASDALGFDLAALCFDGDKDELTLTANAQPAILTASVALLAVLRELTDITPDYLAGHSLGEYSALVAAGALRFSDAVRVVRKRGELMQDAVAPGVGAMAAVLGALNREIGDICREVSSHGFIVTPANYNALGQVVISGHAAAVKAVSRLVREYGTKRVVPLSVSAPFHCPLMAPAAEGLLEALEGVEIGEMTAPVVTNYEAKPNDDPSRVKELLISQVANPVMWRQSVACMSELGVDAFIEIGPGKVLSGLIKRVVQGKNVSNIERVEDIRGIKENGV